MAIDFTKPPWTLTPIIAERQGGRGGAGSKPVTVDGRTFRSLSAAARALRVSLSHVQRWVARGRPDRIGKDNRTDSMAWKREPVEIRGVAYESLTAAAAALGVSRQSVHQARKRGTLDNVGRGRPKGLVYRSRHSRSNAS